MKILHQYSNKFNSMNMKNVLITGATGMIGGIVLQQCLQSKDINKVTSLVRKPSGIEHKKLEEIVVADFSDYSDIEQCFDSIDIVYFCLGVYTGAVSDEKFREITVDYTKSFVDILKKKSPDAIFCFLSGAGADRTEKSKMSFAKYKGLAENYLFDNLKNIYSFRPGYIYPVQKREEPNFGYKISRFLYPLIKLLGKNMSIKSTELGLAMFQSGLNQTGKMVLENKQILQMLN